MTYSVFDYDTKSYNYFQAPGSPPRGQRSVSGRSSEHGMSPEALLEPLPPNAVFVGTGKEPRGILARKEISGGLGSYEDGGSRNKWILASAIALGAYIYYRLRESK